MVHNVLLWRTLIALHCRRPRPDDKWPLDEVCLTINGECRYLWQTVDQDGNVLHILVQSRRNQKAAKEFIRKVLKGLTYVPCVIITNNRAENSHQPTRQQERRMPRFKSPGHNQCFLAVYGLAGLQEAPQTGRPRPFSLAERGTGRTIATSKPADYHCMATRWSGDDIAATLGTPTSAAVLSPSPLWRMLNAADLIPHRSVYGLNSHTPAFEEKTLAICALYGQALRLYQEGRLVIRTDEKTVMQIVQRNYRTHLAQPGQPEKREQECLRYGTRALLASLSQTRCQQWHGRVWFRPWPQRFERAFDPPRPYKRVVNLLVMNL